MESLPVEVQALVTNLQGQIRSDHEQLSSQTSKTEQLVALLEQKMQKMIKDHSSAMAAKDLQISSLQSDLDAANQQTADQKR
jgi:hypothetical protein